jgi:heat shock protein HslJ
MKPILACAALAFAFLLPSCATTPKEPPPKPFAGTRWEAALARPLPEAPWVRFADGRMEGFGGCNRIAARYVEDSVGARAIAIGRIERGMHACEPAARIAEEAFLAVLQSASSYSIAGNALDMTGSAGTVRFRAAGEEAKR